MEQPLGGHMSNETIVLTGWKIEAARLLALRGALKMETLGMRRRGSSALSIIRRELGLKGPASKVLAQLDEVLISRGLLEVR
jgi:hypothetical protein